MELGKNRPPTRQTEEQRRKQRDKKTFNAEKRLEVRRSGGGNPALENGEAAREALIYTQVFFIGVWNDNIGSKPKRE